MGATTKVVFYTIPLIFLIVVVMVFFGETGAWEELKDTALGIKEVLPEMGIGLTNISASDIGISQAQKREILALYGTIKNDMLGNGEACFANFGTLSDLEDISIKFEKLGDNTTFTVLGGAGGKQIVTDFRFTLENAQPCVIAGPRGASTNFFEYYLEEKSTKKEPTYENVNSISIKYDEGVRIFDGNRISVKQFGAGGSVNSESDNFENDGWLFTPDGKSICFFSTNDKRDHTKDGIADEWFKQGKSGSIPTLLGQDGHVKHCSGVN